jgi:hypothetical protein
MGNLKAATADPPLVLDAISPYILPQGAAGQQPASKRRRQAAANIPGMQIPSSFGSGTLGGMGVQPCGLPMGMGSAVSVVRGDVGIWQGIAWFWSSLVNNWVTNPLKTAGSIPNASDVVTDAIMKTGINSTDAAGIVSSFAQSSFPNLIFDFTSNASADRCAISLSPDLGGPLKMSFPVPAIYPSPTHFVETMKILSSSGSMWGGPSSGSLPCSDARSFVHVLASQPHASIIRSAAKDACPIGGWYDLDSDKPGFWVFLWMALWYKYLQNQEHRAVLLSTENKLLMFESGEHTYGVTTTGTAREGLNIVGAMLMLIRALIRVGWMNSYNANPRYLYEQCIKPNMKALLNLPNNIRMNKPDVDAAETASPGTFWWPTDWIASWF